MDLTGPYPKLTDADSVYDVKEYSELMADDVAAAVAALPQGVIKHADSTGGSGAISLQTVVQNMTGVTFIAGRVYRVVWNVNYYQQSASDTFAFGISKCNNGDAAGSVANMTDFRTVSDRVSAAGEGRNKVLEAFYYPTVTETLQVKAWTQRVVGSGGSLFVSASANNPNQLTVEDKGVAPA